MIIVTLEQIIEKDTTVQQILNLKKGYEASRQNPNANWVIVKSN